MTWHLEESGPQSGEWNMRRDESLAMDLLSGRGHPVLRFYWWSPWAISLGWHQPESDIRAEAVARHGYDVVRRPTGGRAILHADELTYCVVCPLERRHPSELYGSINMALMSGLSLLGVRAMLAPSHSLTKPTDREPLSAVCFSSAARSEIKVGGRKLIGSAQRLYRSSSGMEVLLQHGSILCGPGHERLIDFLTRVPEERRESLRSELQSRTTTLGEILGRPIVREEIQKIFRSGFESAWNVEFRELGVTSVALEGVAHT